MLISLRQYTSLISGDSNKQKKNVIRTTTNNVEEPVAFQDYGRHMQKRQAMLICFLSALKVGVEEK